MGSLVGLDTAAAMERMKNGGLAEEAAKSIVDTIREIKGELVTRDHFDLVTQRLGDRIDSLEEKKNAKIDSSIAILNDKIDAHEKAIRSEFQAVSSKHRMHIIVWVLTSGFALTFGSRIWDMLVP